MFNDYLEFLDRCEAYAERDFSAWVDADADFEEPIDDETEEDYSCTTSRISP